ncbi:hypothetical protein B6U79_00670 [Candidatus Bathyarchaeota archaeon ex4484_231]|nr:MAG: hypothetical protein B6U79_00670 [Candidatus Bathyarchaeota archaeon ex4484_231]
MIGAGNWANRVHYPSLAEFRDVELKAVCDLDEEKLNSTCDKYGIELRFKDYKQMLKEVVDLDAVYVIMFPIPIGGYQHAEPLVDIVTYGLRKKKHVFLEKPPGISTEQTKKMAETATANNRRTMVGFNRRFIPIAKVAKKIVEERGMITHCAATYHKNQIKQPKVYGVLDHLTSDAIHAVDALRWMSGSEVKTIASYVRSFYSDAINSFNALVIFENGAIGHLNSCFTAGTRVHRFEMHGKGISAYVDLPQEVDQQKAFIVWDNRSLDKAEIIESSKIVGSQEFHKCYGYYQENRHFIDCIKEDEEPETNLADATKTMMLIDKIKESTVCRL